MVFFCILLYVMLAASAAVPRDTPQDLRGKMFVFPHKTSSNNVRLITNKRGLKAMTFCLRFFTDVQMPYYLFTLASSSHFNSFRIHINPMGDQILFGKGDVFRGLLSQHYKLNTWHSLCATWDAASGQEQIWFNGNPSIRKHNLNSIITGSFIMNLGQENDFTISSDPELSFVGMMTDIHMWDYVVSPCEIKRYTEELSFTPGNVLNWGSLSYFIHGVVLTENKQLLDCL